MIVRDASSASSNSSLTPSEYPCWFVSRHAHLTPEPMHADHGAVSPTSTSDSSGSGARAQNPASRVSSSGTARNTADADSKRRPTAAMNLGLPSNKAYDTPLRGPPPP